jgi:hypothetical protein
VICGQMLDLHFDRRPDLDNLRREVFEIGNVERCFSHNANRPELITSSQPKYLD